MKNRVICINNYINYEWLNLSLNSYKLIGKRLQNINFGLTVAVLCVKPVPIDFTAGICQKYGCHYILILNTNVEYLFDHLLWSIWLGKGRSGNRRSDK